MFITPSNRRILWLSGFLVPVEAKRANEDTCKLDGHGWTLSYGEQTQVSGCCYAGGKVRDRDFQGWLSGLAKGLETGRYLHFCELEWDRFRLP